MHQVHFNEPKRDNGASQMQTASADLDDIVERSTIPEEDIAQVK